VCVCWQNNIQRLSGKNQFSAFFSPDSAEAIVRSGGKIKYYLAAYFFSNSPAKNYQSRLMYVEVAVSQSSEATLLGHRVVRDDDEPSPAEP